MSAHNALPNGEDTPVSPRNTATPGRQRAAALARLAKQAKRDERFRRAGYIPASESGVDDDTMDEDTDIQNNVGANVGHRSMVPVDLVPPAPVPDVVRRNMDTPVPRLTPGVSFDLYQVRQARQELDTQEPDDSQAPAVRRYQQYFDYFLGAVGVTMACALGAWAGVEFGVWKNKAVLAGVLDVPLSERPRNAAPPPQSLNRRALLLGHTTEQTN